MGRLERGKHIDPESPRGYYVDFSWHADARGPVGAFGLPAWRRASRRSRPSPLEIARYALGNLELYLGSGSAERRDCFEAATRMLIDDIEVVPSTFGGWVAQDAPSPYMSLLPSGAFAAGVQGECVSVLARASSLLDVPGALETARTAVAAFSAPVSDGGLLREIGDEGEEGGLPSLAFMEEYPIEDRAVLDLSGHVRAMWGIHDYAAIAEDGAAVSLFDRCVRGLEFELDRFDLGHWTRPNLDAERGIELSGIAGIREQILQMELMYELTGREPFREAACRWRGYQSGWRARSKVFLQGMASGVGRSGGTRRSGRGRRSAGPS